jgi:hypothetical protein
MLLVDTVEDRQYHVPQNILSHMLNESLYSKE